MKNRDGTTSLYKAFIWVCIFAFIITTAVFVIFIIIQLSSSPTDPTETATNAVCLELLGIFAAVVAASYIANIISKRDIEALDEKIDGCKDAISKCEGVKDVVDGLSKKVGAMVPFIDENKDILFRTFIEELDKVSGDIVSSLLADRFRSEQRMGENRGQLFFKLLELEQVYSQMRNRHKSAYKLDDVLLRLAGEGKLLIDALRKEELGKDDAAENELVYQYLNLRYADFDFYAGYCAENKGSGAEMFLAAAAQTEKNLGFDLYGGDNEKVKRRVSAYFENILGECYSKVVHYYTDSLEKEDQLKKLDNINVTLKGKSGKLHALIDEISNLAIEHCKKACESIDANCEMQADGKKKFSDGDKLVASVYYRNLGCAYERKDRLETKGTNKCPIACLLKKDAEAELKENTYSQYDNVVKSFQTSIKMLGGNLIINEDAASNSYYTLLAYYKKYWDALCECKGEGKDNSCSIDFNPEAMDRLTNLAVNMYQVARLAKHDLVRDSRLHYLYGFSCAYIITLLNEGIELGMMCKNVRYYINEMQETVDAMEVLDPCNGYNKPLKGLLSELKS